MSYERHQDAMDTWRRLHSLSDDEARAKAFDNESEFNEVWASAGIAAIVLGRLGMAVEDQDVVLWTKIYGRPLAKVHYHYRQQLERKPEGRVNALTKFAKACPCVPAAIDDLSPDVQESLKRGVA